MILPSYYRPPNGWVRGEKVQHPDLDEWEEVIENGEDYKDLRVRRAAIAKKKKIERLAKKAAASKSAAAEVVTELATGAAKKE